MLEWRDFCEVKYGRQAAMALELWLFGGYTRAESAVAGGMSPAALSRVRDRLRKEWK